MSKYYVIRYRPVVATLGSVYFREGVKGPGGATPPCTVLDPGNATKCYDREEAEDFLVANPKLLTVDGATGNLDDRKVFIMADIAEVEEIYGKRSAENRKKKKHKIT